MSEQVVPCVICPTIETFVDRIIYHSVRRLPKGTFRINLIDADMLNSSLHLIGIDEEIASYKDIDLADHVRAYYLGCTDRVLTSLFQTPETRIKFIQVVDKVKKILPHFEKFDPSKKRKVLSLWVKIQLDRYKEMNERFDNPAVEMGYLLTDRAEERFRSLVTSSKKKPKPKPSRTSDEIPTW